MTGESTGSGSHPEPSGGSDALFDVDDNVDRTQILDRVKLADVATIDRKLGSEVRGYRMMGSHVREPSRVGKLAGVRGLDGLVGI